jgi:hypothetical protein
LICTGRNLLPGKKTAPIREPFVLVAESISAAGPKKGEKAPSAGKKIVRSCWRSKRRKCHPKCCHGCRHWNFHGRRRNNAALGAEQHCARAEWNWHFASLGKPQGLAAV